MLSSPQIDSLIDRARLDRCDSGVSGTGRESILSSFDSFDSIGLIESWDHLPDTDTDMDMDRVSPVQRPRVLTTVSTRSVTPFYT